MSYGKTHQKIKSFTLQQLRWWPKLLFWFCLSPPHSWAQINLVLNPSFEEISDCPRGTAEIMLANGWQNSISPNAGNGSVELFHACVDTFTFRQPRWSYPCTWFGCRFANSGKGYAGLQPLKIHSYDLLRNNQRYLLYPLKRTHSTVLVFCIDST